MSKARPGQLLVAIIEEHGAQASRAVVMAEHPADVRADMGQMLGQPRCPWPRLTPVAPRTQALCEAAGVLNIMSWLAGEPEA
jgi:hypothetical protein